MIRLEFYVELVFEPWPWRWDQNQTLREIPILPVDVVGKVSGRYLIFPLIVLGDPFIFTTKYCIVFLITIARNQSHLCTVDMARI